MSGWCARVFAMATGSCLLSVSIAAEQARPPDALLDLVRFRGEPHAGLDAWRSP